MDIVTNNHHKISLTSDQYFKQFFIYIARLDACNLSALVAFTLLLLNLYYILNHVAIIGYEMFSYIYTIDVNLSIKNDLL